MSERRFSSSRDAGRPSRRTTPGGRGRAFDIDDVILNTAGVVELL